jgi:uncharacterized protein (UPF0333 family)
MKLRFIKRQAGQTSVEYLLVIVVSVGLCMTFYKKFSGYLLDNPDSYMSSHMKLYAALFDPKLNYKKYRLPR